MSTNDKCKDEGDGVSNGTAVRGDKKDRLVFGGIHTPWKTEGN